jgi:hypothetical protein
MQLTSDDNGHEDNYRNRNRRIEHLVNQASSIHKHGPPTGSFIALASHHQRKVLTQVLCTE